MTMVAGIRARAARRSTSRAGWRSPQLPLLGVPLIYFGVAFLVPLAAVVALALSDQGVSGLLSTVTDDLFLLAVRRTLQVAAIVTAICWVVGVIYAFALLLAGRTLRIVLWAVLIGSLAISVVARTYGWILLMNPSGLLTHLVNAIVPGSGEVQLLGTTTAVYIGMTHVMLPIMVVPLYGALQALPASHVKAAQSLGSPPWRVLRRVVLPQLRTGTIAGATLVFLMAFGFYVTPALVGGPNDFMVATLVELYFAREFEYGAASAVATWVVVGVVGAYLIADRIFEISKHWGRA